MALQDGWIPEVEVSVTAACSLACAHCGFLVPEQPEPAVGDPARALEDALAVLERTGLVIGSLAVLGGEATLAPRTLAAALRIARRSPVVQRVELVTNGLTPKGLPVSALADIQRFSLSDYTADTGLADAWKSWLARTAPHIDFVVRRHGSWDAVYPPVDVGESGGQLLYDTCWYRRHCVTLERGRIFVCSRIPKLRRDDEGLQLDSESTREDIIGYLTAPAAPGACRSCTPMAGLAKVHPGVQPDRRLDPLRAAALTWFEAREVVS